MESFTTEQILQNTL